MKKSFLTAILWIFILLSVSAETRTFYFTRHGQRGDPRWQKHFKYLNEDALMPNGEEQAKQLGLYLKSLDFKGPVYVSPYYRTLQTATFAANQFTDEKLILEPRLQEIVGLKDTSGKVRHTKKCLTKKEIKENFPNVRIPRGTKFPWRLENESQVQQDGRIDQMVTDVLKKTEGDVFFVCHGAIMASVIRVMNNRGADFPRKKVYNCCLYSFTFDTKTGKVVEFRDHTLEFLSGDLITDNLAYILIPPVKE